MASSTYESDSRAEDQGTPWRRNGGDRGLACAGAGPPSEHPYKYRLVYVVDGRRVVGYDNERGKGDHRHLGESEERYRFIDPDTLLADFWRDVEGAAA